MEHKPEHPGLGESLLLLNHKNIKVKGDKIAVPIVIQLDHEIAEAKIDVDENVVGKVELAYCHHLQIDDTLKLVDDGEYKDLHKELKKTLVTLYCKLSSKKTIHLSPTDEKLMVVEGLDTYLHKYFLKYENTHEFGEEIRKARLACLTCDDEKKFYETALVGYRAAKFVPYFEAKDSLIAWFSMIAQTASMDQVYISNNIIWKGFVSYMDEIAQPLSLETQVSLALKLAKIITQLHLEQSWYIWSIPCGVIQGESFSSLSDDPIGCAIKDWLKTFA